MATEIVALKRVSAYRSADGKLHDTRLNATRHQAKLDLLVLLEECIGMDGMTMENIAEALTSNSDDLMRLLKAATKGDA